MHLISSYGKGLVVAAFGVHALVGLVIALIIVAIVAAIVGLLVNLILPPHGRIAAAVVFLLGLLIVLADYAG
jgi:hypothetical protein